MITVPTDSWYTGWFGGHCTGPYKLDGTSAIDTIPSPVLSEFGQNEGYEGQNYVSHHKTEIDVTIDGFAINGDSRDHHYISSVYPAYRDIWRIYFTGVSGYQTAPFGGRGRGSWGHVDPKGWASYAVLTPSARGYDYFSYSISEYWLNATHYEIYTTSPIVPNSPTSNVGYANYVFRHKMASRRREKDEYVATPASLAGMDYGSWSNPSDTPRRGVFYRRSGLTTPDVSEPSLKALMRKFSDQVPSFGDELQSYGHLSQLALNNLTVIDTNLLESLSEVASLKKLAKNLLKIPKWVSTKKLAGDYLSVKWGAIPFVDDLNQVYKSFSAISPTINNFGLVPCSGTDLKNFDWEYEDSPVQCTATRRAHLYIAPDKKLYSLTQWFRNHGLYPSAQNLWDIIPFSFVLDWFVNVGRYLEEVDSNNRFGELSIVVCVYSEKSEHATSYFDPKWGQVELKHSAYDRFPSRTPAYPSYNFQSSDFSLHKRWLEAGALILQLKK